MKPLGLRQPLAYLTGVVAGDAWLTTVLGLRVADRDFAIAFVAAIREGFGIRTKARRDERGYWLVRSGAESGRFDALRRFKPITSEARAAWLRGLFDSEGNANLSRKPQWENSWDRRVSFYSTNPYTIALASHYLDELGIPNRFRGMKASKGHKGTRPVVELVINASKENYLCFAEVIGSSIRRKQRILDRIPTTYTVDMVAMYRAAQLKGAASRHQKTMTVTLPFVVEGVRALMARGIKPTQRACRSIVGYSTIQRHVSQASLISMAHRYV
jgi:hypothetical protein